MSKRGKGLDPPKQQQTSQGTEVRRVPYAVMDVQLGEHSESASSVSAAHLCGCKLLPRDWPLYRQQNLFSAEDPMLATIEETLFSEHVYY